MKYDVLYNFISPVTGRLPIEEGYILIGGGDGFSIKSPILIDMRLDLINLRRDVNDIFDTSFIIGFPDIDFPQAQVLSELENGFLYNTAGIVSTSSTIPITGLPDLTHKNLWIGNSSNRPEETQRIQIDNLPTFFNALNPPYFGAYSLWTGSANPLTLGEPTVTTALNIVNLPDLTPGKLWIGEPGLLPGSGRPTEIEVLPLDNMAELGFNKLWLGNVFDRPTPVDKIEGNNLPDLTQNYLWTGDINNRPVETQTLIVDNLPNLFYKAIWRGNISGRPEPTEDLTQLELKVTIIEDVTIPAIEAAIEALEAEIIALQAEIAALEAEIGALQIQIGILDAAVAVIQIQLALLQAADDAIRARLTALENDVAVIQGQIGVIQAQITTIFGTLTNHNNRITILENQMIQVQQDIVDINFRIDNLEVTLEGDVTGSGNINSPIVTTLQLTLDEIKIAQDTVNLNDQKIINLKSDEVEQKDALNAKFLWDLMHDQVEVVWA